MNPNIDFGILVVILLFIGNEVTQVKRKLEKLEETLNPSQESTEGPLQTTQNELENDIEELKEHIDWHFENAAIDLKNANASLKYDIGTIQGNKLDSKLDDIIEKLDNLSD